MKKKTYNLSSCGQIEKQAEKKTALAFMDWGQFSDFQGHKSQSWMEEFQHYIL